MFQNLNALQVDGQDVGVDPYNCCCLFDGIQWRNFLMEGAIMVVLSPGNYMHSNMFAGNFAEVRMGDHQEIFKKNS